MGFGLAIKTCFQKFTDFSGRASRPEYWNFVLLLVILNLLLTILEGATNGDLQFKIGIWFGLGSSATWPMNIFSAIFALPFLSATTRRLNDAGAPAGKVFAALFALFVALSFASKITSNNLPFWLITGPLALFGIAVIYLLARKTAPLTRGSLSNSEPAQDNPPVPL